MAIVSVSDSPHWGPVVIRLAVAADEAPLRRLAQLDSARPLGGPKLLAEHAGSLVAAVSMADGSAIADPFRMTAETLELLRLRAAQMGRAQQTGRAQVSRAGGASSASTSSVATSTTRI